MEEIFNDIFDEVDLSGISLDDDETVEYIFEFKANFRIIDDKNKYLIELKKVFKNDLKKYNTDVVNIVLNKFPLSCKDINNLDVEEVGFKIREGVFKVQYLNENCFDIFLLRLI